jgi:hypothetical protein
LFVSPLFSMSSLVCLPTFCHSHRLSVQPLSCLFSPLVGPTLLLYGSLLFLSLLVRVSPLLTFVCLPSCLSCLYPLSSLLPFSFPSPLCCLPHPFVVYLTTMLSLSPLYCLPHHSVV